MPRSSDTPLGDEMRNRKGAKYHLDQINSVFVKTSIKKRDIYISCYWQVAFEKIRGVTGRDAIHSTCGAN